MLPYWLLFGFYAFGAAIYRLKPRGEAMEASPLMVAAALVAALMIGFRYEVGADWFNYVDIYEAAGRLSVSELLTYGDPGYMILNVVGQRLNLDIWFVNLACGLVFMWGLVKFAQQQPNPWLAVTVAVPYLLIVVVMGYTRQGVAIALIMAAVGPFERGRYLQFLALMALATAFHKTAIVALPLIVLATARHRLVIYGTAAAIGFLIFFIFLDAFLSRLLSNYLETERSSEGAGIRIAMNALPAAVFFLFSRRLTTSEQEKLIWRNFALASVAMIGFLAVLPSSTVVDRVALYMIPIQIFVLSRLPYAFPAGHRGNPQLTLLVIIYSALIQTVWLIYAAHAEYWLPYRVFPFLLG